MARVRNSFRHLDHSRQHPAGFSIRVTLYGQAHVKIADRAMVCVEREKRRQYHLIE